MIRKWGVTQDRKSKKKKKKKNSHFRNIFLSCFFREFLFSDLSFELCHALAHIANDLLCFLFSFLGDLLCLIETLSSLLTS